VVGTDETTPLTAVIVDELRSEGHDVEVIAETMPWPEVGRQVGEAVASGAADRGVVGCWTGTGVCMAANKVAGVRAALCGDAETARGARRWNDANVLALSLRLSSAAVGIEIVKAFFATAADPTEGDNIARLE
jgi:ribose 5-phosphate isomerase B